MLGFWPTPLPEETLFSILARAQRIAYLTNRQIRSVFGVIRVNPEIYQNLDGFKKMLPEGHSMLEEDIVRTRTLYNIFTFGVTSERKSALAKAMMSEGSRQAAIYSNWAHAGRSQILKHCPKCSAEQEAPYWMRIHQIPTVTACTIHQCRLHKVPQSTSAKLALPEKVEETPQAEQWEVDHAILCQEILRGIDIDPEGLTELFRERAVEQGWAKLRGGKLRYSPTAILERAKRINSADFWEEVGSKPNKPSLPASVKGFIDNRQNSFQGKLLVLRLGEINSELLCQGPGRPKYRCKNPFSKCGEATTIKVANTVKNNRLALECPECRFSYTVAKAELEKTREAGRPPSFSTQNHGPVWDQEFSKLWNNEKLLNQSICEKAGISNTSLIYQGNRLGLKARTKTRPPTKAKGRKGTKPDVSGKREEWLKILQENQRLSRSGLRRKFRRESSWLEKHDKEWFFKNLPQHRKHARHDATMVDRVLEILEKASECLSPNESQPSLRSVVASLPKKEADLVCEHLHNRRVAKKLQEIRGRTPGRGATCNHKQQTTEE